MLPNYVAKDFPVALDFDGCIAIGEHVKIKYAKLYHKIEITPRTCTSVTYPLGSVMYKELMEKITVLHTDEFTLDPHCKQVLDNLCTEGFNFHIVTSRYDQQINSCRQFIKSYKLPISSINGTSDNSKESVCSKMHIRAIIDDSSNKLISLTNSNMNLFFLRREWNMHEQLNGELDKRIFTIFNWKDFEVRLKEVKLLHEAVCYYNNLVNNNSNLPRIYQLIRNDSLYADRCLHEFKRIKQSI